MSRKEQDDEFSQISFHKRLRQVTKSWPIIEKDLDTYREQISEDYFSTHPERIARLKYTLLSGGAETETIKVEFKKLRYKHSFAVVNFMEMIAEFVSGNEESKPIFFILGKQHKKTLVNEKMFFEMKGSICKVIEAHLGEDSAKAWEIVIEYIYIHYVFKGMDMIPTV